MVFGNSKDISFAGGKDKPGRQSLIQRLFSKAKNITGSDQVADWTKSDINTIVGIGTFAAANLFHLLPVGVWGLYTGVGAFGAGAFISAQIGHIINKPKSAAKSDNSKPSEPSHEAHKGRALKIFATGLIASSALAITPALVRAGLENGYYKRTSPAVKIAAADARWLKLDEDAGILDPGYGHRPHLDRNDFSNVPVYLKKGAFIEIFKTANLELPSNLKAVNGAYCAEYGVTTTAFNASGIVKLTDGISEGFASNAGKWIVSKKPDDIKRCNSIFKKNSGNQPAP